jgi:hypothetical protein
MFKDDISVSLLLSIYFLPSLTYRCGCLRREVEAANVGRAHAVEHELVRAEALVRRDGEIGAGVQVDQVQHVGHRLHQPQPVLQPAGARIYMQKQNTIS